MSHYFYRGEWRPHFREFSRGELEFFLTHSGFSIVRHEFFERRQGDYYRNDRGNVVARNRYRSIKGYLQRAILEAAPPLRDHQIVVAIKK
jgi:hypothetical protein